MDQLEAFAAFLAFGAGIDWADELHGYDWNGNWRAGIDKRFEHHAMISAALGPAAHPDEFAAAAETIRTWGGIRARIQLPDLVAFRNSSVVLAGGPAGIGLDDARVAGVRIATASKIYGAVDPRVWSIYDSRVGRELQRRVRQHVQLPADIAPPAALQFKMPPPQGNPPPPAPDPTVRVMTTPAQGRRGFLRASHVFRRVASMLRGNGGLPIGLHHVDQTWQAYHIEMAMFAMGVP